MNVEFGKWKVELYMFEINFIFNFKYEFGM